MKILNFNVDFLTFQSNQILLQNILKEEIVKKDPKFASYLNGNEIFSEPLLYYYIFENKCNYSIEQLILGYIDNYYKDEEIFKITKDTNGAIYFPNKGYIIDQRTIENIKYKSQQYYNLHNNNHIIFTSPILLCDTSIELLNFISPVITDVDNNAKNINIGDLNKNNIKNLQIAIKHIKENNAVFYELFVKSTKNITFFKSNILNSFATILSHGTCFINVVSDNSSEVFFIEDIAHQCGHIAFNIMTLKADQYLNFPKETPFNKFNKNVNDPRILYAVFHGLFTYSCILDCLDKYISNKSYSTDRLKNEALARIGFFTMKMKTDLEPFFGKNILTNTGDVMYKEFIDSYSDIYDKYISYFKSYKYTRQPYIFDFDIFCSENRWDNN